MMDVGFLSEDDFVPLSKVFKKGFWTPRYMGYQLDGVNYWFGKKYSFFDIPDIAENRILRTNMKNNNFTHIVLTRTGRSVEYQEGDVVIEPEGDYMDKLFECTLNGATYGDGLNFSDCSI